MELKSGYKQTEIGVIPEDWNVLPLENFTSFISYGFTNPMPFVSSGIALVTAKDVNYGKVQFNSVRFTTEFAYQKLLTDKSRPKKNDLLLTKDGTLGRLAVVDETTICINQSVAILRPNQQISPLFFKLLLESPKYQRCMLDNAGGSTIKHIYITVVNKMVLGVPNCISEQNSIATALSDVDALLDKLDALIAKKRDLKQAAMQQLLSAQTRLPGFSGEWSPRTLGECLSSRPSYGINAAAVPYSDQLPAYIRITDISEHGQFNPSPPSSVNSPSASQYYLSEGDLVFARTGASVGKSYLYLPSDGPLVFAGFLIKIRPAPSLLQPKFLFQFVQTKTYWDWVTIMSMRSGQPGINGNEFAQLPMLLPSIKEQIAIATILSHMDAEITALEARRDKTHALKQGMMQELLTGKIRLLPKKST